jgi:hypothetical protein
MTTHQAAEIMMHQAKDVPDADNYPISILLLAGLTDTFRCEEQTRRVVRPGVEPAEQQPRQAIHRKHRGYKQTTHRAPAKSETLNSLDARQRNRA